MVCEMGTVSYNILLLLDAVYTLRTKWNASTKGKSLLPQFSFHPYTALPRLSQVHVLLIGLLMWNALFYCLILL